MGSDRKPVIVETQGQYFVGPDNGLFGFANDAKDGSFWKISLDEGTPTSATFHGRDVFAPAAGKLASGKLPGELGSAIDAIAMLPETQAVYDDQHADGEVIHIDHFGNLITNLYPRDWMKSKEVSIRVGELVIENIETTYADQGEGDKLALWNSAGRLEIAVRNGSAAKELNIIKGTRVRIQHG